MTIIYHPDYVKHVQQRGHPESPERLISTVEKLKEECLFTNVLKPERATFDEMAIVHLPSYIETIRDFGEGYYDMDTYVRPETFNIASLAVGGALLSTRHSFENSQPSIALIRPPGHHAGRNYAGGFCYFNNIAVGAEYLARKGKKIAVVDLDVHHGNGTADIFSERKDVLYISTHLWGIYPGTGAIDDVGSREGEGFTVNIPFKSRCGDASFNLAFDKVIEPILVQFKPEMILVSLGVDAHYRDILGNLTLSSPGYLALSERLISISKGKCTFMLEGGYDVPALAEVIAGLVGIFETKDVKLKFNEVIDKEGTGRDIVKKVVEVQKRYWKLE